MNFLERAFAWISRLFHKQQTPHASLGLLDQLLGLCLETWGGRYAFEFDRERQVIRFTKGGMLAIATAADHQVIIQYEQSPHETVQESCTPEQAATLIDLIMARASLSRVSWPP